MRQVIQLLSDSIEVVRETSDQEEFSRYTRLIAGVMGEIMIEIEQPIYEQYDDLMPDELRSPK
jgi:hypothetical protein